MTYKNILFNSSNRSIGQLIIEGIKEKQTKSPDFFSQILEYMTYIEMYFFDSNKDKNNLRNIAELDSIIVVKV